MPRSRPSYSKFLLAIVVGFTLTQTALVPTAHAEGWKDSIKGFLGNVKKTFCPDDRPEPVIKPNQSPIAAEPPSDQFKSEGELRQYIKCYSVEPGRYDKVQNEYMPIIKAAAKSFNIPSTLLTCLLFRESRFDVNARSGTGAIGLGQHLTGTMKHITDILRPSKEDETQKLLEIVNTPVAERIAAKQATPAMAQKDLNYAKTVLRDREFRLKWEEHFKTQNEKKCRAESVKKPEPPKAVAANSRAKPGKPVKAAAPAKPLSTEQKYEMCLEKSIPRVVSTANISDPKIAITASAMYLQMILTDFKRALDTDVKTTNGDKQNPNYDLLLTAAGAYNMGPGAAIEILGPIEPPDRKKWVEALMKSNEETAGHVASIRNCIQSSASQGDAFQAPVGSHNYNCNPDAIKQDARTTRGMSDLPASYKNKVKSASMKTVAVPTVTAAKEAARATAKAAAKPGAAKPVKPAKPK